MGRAITRRDFLQDSSLAALGLTAPVGGLAGSGDPASSSRYYPPTKTGLRGSHEGTFEVPHAMALEGKSFDDAEPTGEEYDLVVVGGGISGLATALYYQDRFGKEARILNLENHDDFGGHAQRNEFHQGGELRLALGGGHNLEYTSFSQTDDDLMGRLGIDIASSKRHTGFYYGYEDRGCKPALYFDAERYGEDVLITVASMFDRHLLKRP